MVSKTVRRIAWRDESSGLSANLIRLRIAFQTGLRNFVPNLVCGLVYMVAIGSPAAAQDTLRAQAIDAMRKATEFYTQQAAVEGGYVYYYSPDLSRRMGEGPAGKTRIWVQPPGTPTVGIALLRAYRATGDTFYLQTARRAAMALVYGQLRSGGWTASIDMEPAQRGFPFEGGKKRRDSHSSLDDGQTQMALQFLMSVDREMAFGDKQIHDAVTLALDSLLAAQFPCGGFPQVWRGPVAPQEIVAASYPDTDYRTVPRIKNYWDMYTLNDNVCGYVVDTLIMAHQIYDDPRYLRAIERLGNFLVLAQMPLPQPGWCQQYDYQMQPIWARRFEPPAIAGDESQETIETLLKIFEVTGDAQYLAPIPVALDYLERSQLSDGQLARFYELRTNRPLYMVRQGDQYQLTYDDSRLPGHYGWKTPSRLPRLRQLFQKAAQQANARPAQTEQEFENGPADDFASVTEIVDSLDDQGRWISIYDGEPLVGQPKFADGEPYLSSARFSSNLSRLADYVSEAK
jgi:PelA/Pel-15E family pectate lyase